MFEFDSVFSPECGQEEIFEDTKQLVQVSTPFAENCGELRVIIAGEFVPAVGHGWLQRVRVCLRSGALPS